MNDVSLVAADGGPAQREAASWGSKRSYPLAFALLLVSYGLTAWAGLQWATVAGVASPIWPSAGIAVAGLLLGGWRLFPAIVIAATVTALATGTVSPWWVLGLLAMGKAASAAAAVTLIRRFGRPSFNQLSSVHDILLLLGAALLAGGITTLVSISALAAGELLSAPGVALAGLTWFFGDALAILTVTAAVLTTVAQNSDHRRLIGRMSPVQFAVAMAALAGLCGIVFFTPGETRAWAIYPALVGVALVGRVQGASFAMLLVCGCASVGSLMGLGPFARASGAPDLVLLQQFLATSALTALLLAAAVDERRTESKLRQIAADELAAREELGRTASLLKLVGDGTPSLIYAKDLEGRLIYANEALLALYDKPSEDVLGRTDLELSPPTEAEAFRANDRQVMDSGTSNEVEEHLTVDGKVRTFYSVKAPLRDAAGAIAGIVGISTDMTERRQQQQEFESLARRAEIAQRAARSSLYEYDIATGAVLRDPILADLCGIRRHELGPAQSDWEKHIHPDDLADFRSTLSSALAHFEGFALEYRVLGSAGQVTWVSDKGTIIRGPDGTVQQVIGLVTDVTPQKHAEEREHLLAREVDHRAKNLLAVVQSVVQLTRAKDGEELKAGIIGRIQSLARAHGLLAESRWEGVELSGLAREEVAPYSEEQDDRVSLRGPRLLLRPAAAQSIALILHELATNAAKYGALSTASGRVELSWCIEQDGGLLLVWQERDGPESPVQQPRRSGFGSRLIKASVERQLGGTLDYDWAAAGVTVTMTIAPEFIALSDVSNGSRSA